MLSVNSYLCLFTILLNREAHPGGAMKTNKAAALAKFLERKLQEPNGLASVNPKLVELAVKNAKQTVQLSMNCLYSLD